MFGLASFFPLDKVSSAPFIIIPLYAKICVLFDDVESIHKSSLLAIKSCIKTEINEDVVFPTLFVIAQ